jgi:hypothetical protein
MAEEEVKSLTAPVELTKEAQKRDRCVCGGEYACKRERFASRSCRKNYGFYRKLKDQSWLKMY